MKERGIIFCGPMVRAVLAGRKTQTRRVTKDRFYDLSTVRNTCMEGFSAMRDGFAVFDIQDTVDSSHEYKIRCPYGVPGDRLWVRETWCDVPVGDGSEMGVIYRADGDDAEDGVAEGWEFAGKWRSSRHMPRRASRIDLENRNIRCERVEDISEADARAEGFVTSAAFLDEFYRLNAKRIEPGSNPWVWAIEFKRSER